MKKRSMVIYGMIIGFIACGILIGSEKKAKAASTTSAVPTIVGAEKTIYLDGKDKISVQGKRIVSIKYTSTKKAVATVSSKGIIQPKKKGKTTIKATVIYRKKSGGKKYTKKIGYKLTVLGKTKEYFLIGRSAHYYTIKGFTTKGGKLRNVYVPGYLGKYRITTVKKKAFVDNKSMKTLHLSDNIKILENQALNGCSNLEKVYFGKDFSFYTSYGGFWNGCTSLSKIILDSRNKNYKLVDDVLFSKDGTKLYRYPAKKAGTKYTIPDNTEYIYDSAFCDCVNLKSIEIPDSVKSLLDYCFSNSGLTSMTLTDEVKYWGDGVFADCASLTEVSLSKSFTSISCYAFKNCKSLKSITIPSKINKVYANSFLGCEQLTDFKVSEASETLTEMDGVLYSKDKKNLVLYPFGRREISYTVASETERIEPFAFRETVSLETVVLPDGLKDISTGAFLGTSLKEVTVPDSVTVLEERVFEECASLTDVKLSKNLREIRQGTFNNCVSLQKITIPQEVSAIGSYYCHASFEGCDKLSYIDVDKNNTTFTSIDGILYSKSKQTLYYYPPAREDKSFSIPNYVRNIRYYAFKGAKYLKTLSIPKEVINLECAFAQCESVERIQLPSKLPNDTLPSFEGCTSLKKITIPSGVTTISAAAFRNCDSLKTVVMPNTVTKINNYAFYHCDKLRNVTLGSKVKKIGDDTFASCKNLKKVTIKSKRITKALLGKNVFSMAGANNYKKLVIKVPAAKKNLYQKIFCASGLSKLATVK